MESWYDGDRRITHQVVQGEGLYNVVGVVGSVCLTKTGQHCLH